MHTLLDVFPLAQEIAWENFEASPEKFPVGVGIESETGYRYYDPYGECPSCFLGVLLNRLGYDDGVLRVLDSHHQGYGCAVRCNSKEHTAEAGLNFWAQNFTKEARAFLDDIQSGQDNGLTWGAAFEFAVQNRNEDEKRRVSRA